MFENGAKPSPKLNKQVNLAAQTSNAGGLMARPHREMKLINAQFEKSSFGKPRNGIINGQYKINQIIFPNN